MTRSAKQIQEWMIDRLSQLTGIAPQDIDPREPVRRYGLDSVALVTFTTDLENWLANRSPHQPTDDEPFATGLFKTKQLGYRFHSNPLEDHPTIEALAAFLAHELAKGIEHAGEA